jgi:hypothetical protein
MKTLFLVLATAIVCTSSFAANDKECDSCMRAASAAALACTQKAKNADAKKACDNDEKKQKQVCQLSRCKKGLF